MTTDRSDGIVAARSVAAVVAGYLIFAVSSGLLFRLSGRDPHLAPATGFLVFSIAYGMAFALAGGFVAASIATRQRTLHALAVAGMIAVTAFAALIVEWGAGSLWSQLTTLVLMAPAAAIGGYLRR
jgi:hypothetical protein